LLSVNVNTSGKPEGRPPVSVKGVNDGLLFLLDEECEHEVLTAYLRELLFENPSQLLSGPDVKVSVDYGNRNLTAQENLELLQLFLQKDNFCMREWSSNTVARRALFANRNRPERQNIHKGTIRAGQQVYYDGDVVVIGDVNPGGEIIATGDIYVFGRLRGIAHAGARGDTSAIIAAAEFAPLQLRIAGTVTRVPKVDGRVMNTFMEFAYLRDDGMAVDKMHYLFAIRGEKKAKRKRG
jgi:septum site-determining protein MinC